jgi:hypothetical protein
MKRKAGWGGGNSVVATDTFVFLCDTNVKGTIAMQCRRPAEMSHSTCPLADFDYVRPKVYPCACVCCEKSNTHLLTRW